MTKYNGCSQQGFQWGSIHSVYMYENVFYWRTRLCQLNTMCLSEGYHCTTCKLVDSDILMFTRLWKKEALCHFYRRYLTIHRTDVHSMTRNCMWRDEWIKALLCYITKWKNKGPSWWSHTGYVSCHQHTLCQTASSPIYYSTAMTLHTLHYHLSLHHIFQQPISWMCYSPL